jgi:hypothetical protein
MSEPSSENKSRTGPSRPSGGQSGSPTDWERRAADMANEVQRWLIRQSARNMRDEFGDQMKKAMRGPAPSKPEDVWATATTEPPDAASQPPECAWCPICRAARRMAQAQIAGQVGGSAKGAGSGPGAGGAGVGSTLAGATDAIVGAARDALTGLDAILSYRPGDLSSPKPASDGAGASASGSPGRASASGSAGGASASGSPGGASEPVIDSQPEGRTGSQAGEPEHEPDHRG